MRYRFACLLVLHPAHAHAEPVAPAPPQQVVVTGQTEVESNRDLIAGTIVIDKARIAGSGLQNTGELLRREPAISVGKDGRIGLLGLPGYTQVLVDGLPQQGDAFAIDLAHVERIEIVKSTTAATGPVGIAGTINIVRRKSGRKLSSQLRAGVRTEGGKPGLDAAWSTNGVSGGLLSYNLTLSAMRRLTMAHSDYRQSGVQPGTASVQEFDGNTSMPGVSELYNATSVLAWILSPSHSLTFSPEGGHYNFGQDSHERRRWRNGRSLTAHQTGTAPTWTYSLPLLWDWKPDADSSLALKLNMNRSHTDGRVRRDERWLGERPRQRTHERDTEASNHFLDLDFATETEDGHRISAGARFVRNESDTGYSDLIDGLPDSSLSMLGSETASRMVSARLFVQDEWRINRRWALNLGASAERRDYKLYEGLVSNRAQFTLWSPSVHVSHRIKGNRKRQLRLSLARSYRPPFLDEMLLRPQINPFAPCPAQDLCGTNSIDTADSSGNPNLRPERALGLNISYSHGIGRDSEVLVEWYARDIRDKTGSELSLLAVPWAGASRYVVRQTNLGQAKVRGLNLEARLAGKDLSPQLANLELNGSIGLTDSELSDLPGPDNHIPEQLPWRAKVSGNYALRSLPLKLGIDASYLPHDWVRNGVNQQVYESSRRTLNLNASWSVNKSTTLRFNLDNLLDNDKLRIDEYLSRDGVLGLSTRSSNHARVALRFETSL